MSFHSFRRVRFDPRVPRFLQLRLHQASSIRLPFRGLPQHHWPPGHRCPFTPAVYHCAGSSQQPTVHWGGRRRFSQRVHKPQGRHQQKDKERDWQWRGIGRSLVSALLVLSGGVLASHLWSKHRREQLAAIDTAESPLKKLQSSVGGSHFLISLQLLALLRLLETSHTGDEATSSAVLEQRWVLHRMADLLGRSVVARSLLVEYGGVEQLVKVALSPVAVSSIRGTVVRVFNLLCSTDQGQEFADRIIKTGGLPLYGSVFMEYHDCHPFLVDPVHVRKLLSLSSAPRPRLPAATPEGPHWQDDVLLDPDRCLLPLLVSLSHDDRETASDTSIEHIQAVLHEWSSSYDSHSTPMFDVENVVDYLHEHMSKQYQLEEMYYHSLRALASLVRVDGNGDVVVAHGGVALVRQIVDAYGDEVRVKLQAARALANLCRSREAAEAIVAEGLADLLLQWLEYGEPSGIIGPVTTSVQSTAGSRDEYVDVLQCHAARAIANIRRATSPRSSVSPLSVGPGPVEASNPAVPPFYDDGIVLLHPLLSSIRDDCNSSLMEDVFALARRRVRRAAAHTAMSGVQTLTPPDVPDHSLLDPVRPPHVPASVEHCDALQSTNHFDVDVVLVHGLLGNAISTWGVGAGHALSHAIEESGLKHMELPEGTQASTLPLLLDRLQEEKARVEDAVAEARRSTRRQWGFQQPQPVVPTTSEARDGAAAAVVPILPEPMKSGSSDELPFVCWPKEWLPLDLCQRHGRVRVMSLKYNSFLSAWSGEQRSLAERAQVALRALHNARVGMPTEPDRPRRIVFITHSMGGLLVKHILAKSEHIAAQTAVIVFLSTPHFGSMLPDLAKYVPRVVYSPSREVLELKRDNAELGMLNKVLENRPHISVISYGEKQATPLKLVRNIISTHIVPLDSCNPGVGEFHAVDRTHYNICKPHSRSDVVYRGLVSYINRALHTPTK